MSNDLLAAALDIMASTPALLRSLLDALPDEVTEQPADATWSPKDVVAHLLMTSKQGGVTRIRAIIAQDEPALPAFDEEVELERSGLRVRPLAEILDEFARVREDDVVWLKKLDGASLARSGRHSQVGLVTAEEFLYHSAHHDCLHIGQLSAMIQGQFEPLRGAMRVF